MPLSGYELVRPELTCKVEADQLLAGPGRSSDDDLFIPFSRGHIRACGLSIATQLSLPANSGPASEDAFPEEFRLRSTLS